MYVTGREQSSFRLFGIGRFIIHKLEIDLLKEYKLKDQTMKQTMKAKNNKVGRLEKGRQVNNVSEITFLLITTYKEQK